MSEASRTETWLLVLSSMHLSGRWTLLRERSKEICNVNDRYDDFYFTKPVIFLHNMRLSLSTLACALTYLGASQQIWDIVGGRSLMSRWTNPLLSVANYLESSQVFQIFGPSSAVAVCYSRRHWEWAYRCIRQCYLSGDCRIRGFIELA